MIKSKMRNTLLVAAMAAGGLMMGMTPAHATPGTVWSGTDGLLFDVTTLNPGVGPGGFLSANPTQLEWVDTGNATDAHSYLRILPPSNAPVNIISEGGWADVAVLQHENNIIPVGSFGFTVDLTDNFQLAGANFNLTGTDALPTATLGLTFLETPNNSPCPGLNPLSSTCDDTFTVAGLNSVINSFLFTGLGELWQLEFRLFADPLAGSFFNGVNTIYTAEDFTSLLRIQAQITQVPEPASIALLGLGLAGLPLFARRRRAAKKADVTES